MISQDEAVGGEDEERTAGINNAPLTLLIRPGIFRRGVAGVLVQDHQKLRHEELTPSCWWSCRQTTAALIALTKERGAQLRNAWHKHRAAPEPVWRVRSRSRCRSLAGEVASHAAETQETFSIKLGAKARTESRFWDGNQTDAA